MKIKAFIFDFDGTIIDSEFADFEAWRRVFFESGASIDIHEWLPCYGTLDSPFDPIESLKRKTGHFFSEDRIISYHHQIYHEILNQLQVLPGLDAYMQYAEENNIQLAIASGGKRDFVLSQLSRLNLINKFSQICTFDDVYLSKPNPALYHCILKKLELEPQDTIAFEDSPVGVAAAKSAGIFCIRIENQINKYLPTFGADLNIQSLKDYLPEELLTLINRLKN